MGLIHALGGEIKDDVNRSFNRDAAFCVSDDLPPLFDEGSYGWRGCIDYIAGEPGSPAVYRRKGFESGLTDQGFMWRHEDYAEGPFSSRHAHPCPGKQTPGWVGPLATAGQLSARCLAGSLTPRVKCTIVIVY
jgi:hypothetical protein